jgi:hypothetical protein
MLSTTSPKKQIPSNKTSSILAVFAAMVLSTALGLSSDALYPSKENRQASPGNTSYFIDPAKGNDSHSGLDEKSAWRSFTRINQLLLAAGDKVKITSPGSFDQTIMLMGSGTVSAPIELSFAPGQYDFHTKTNAGGNSTFPIPMPDRRLIN